MPNRSCVPKYIKRGRGKSLKKEISKPMNFRKANARKKRPDTGKKHNLGKHNTPSKIYK